MKIKKSKKQKKIIIPTEKDPLYKFQKCDWCDREKVMTKRFISEYFKGYYCECCCELAEMAYENDLQIYNERKQMLNSIVEKLSDQELEFLWNNLISKR